MVRVGRDLCGSSRPTLLPKQGHPEQAAQVWYPQSLYGVASCRSLTWKRGRGARWWFRTCLAAASTRSVGSAVGGRRKPPPISDVTLLEPGSDRRWCLLSLAGMAPLIRHGVSGWGGRLLRSTSLEFRCWVIPCSSSCFQNTRLGCPLLIDHFLFLSEKAVNTSQELWFTG